MVAACDEVAHIPIRSESLNAAMAATVALYESTVGWPRRMIERIAELRPQGEAAIAGATGTAALEEARVRFLGRKAELPNLLRGVAQLPPEERGAVGRAANEARRALEAAIEARQAALERRRARRAPRRRRARRHAARHARACRSAACT